MRGLVSTMFDKIESMKKFDAHESQFWKNLSSPNAILQEQELMRSPEIPLDEIDIAIHASTQSWIRYL